MRSHLAKGAGLRGAGLGFRRELMAEREDEQHMQHIWVIKVF
ncbi:MAG: hypothetical protein ACYCXG_09365 [Acidiferrobacter sp.]